MTLLLAAASIAVQPLMTEAEVSTSNGKRYKVETCFRDARHLTTRFIYPDRTVTLAIDGDEATVVQSGKPSAPAGDAEKRLAFGHHFHAIYYNFAQLTSDRRPARGGAVSGLRPGWTGNLAYGGLATLLHSESGRGEGLRFDLPGTSPIDLRFGDWSEGGLPHRMSLNHEGVRYEYRYTRIMFRC